MNASQADKAARFRALHEGPAAFLIANPWDPGSARILRAMGFPALATSSGASAAVVGRQDGKLGRDAALAHARAIAAATDLPVSADLENGFGDAPATVAETIALAAGAASWGARLKTPRAIGAQAPYDLDFAVRRVKAAVDAAHSLPFPFVLTARTENFLRGKPDLDDTIARLRAFEKAGADVVVCTRLT